MNIIQNSTKIKIQREAEEKYVNVVLNNILTIEENMMAIALHDMRYE